MASDQSLRAPRKITAPVQTFSSRHTEVPSSFHSNRHLPMMQLARYRLTATQLHPYKFHENGENVPHHIELHPPEEAVKHTKAHQNSLDTNTSVKYNSKFFHLPPYFSDAFP